MFCCIEVYPKTLDNPRGSVGCAHLVICHSSIQVSDETIQGLGTVNVSQELHDPVSLGERSELPNYPIQLPADNQYDLEMRQFLSKGHHKPS